MLLQLVRNDFPFISQPDLRIHGICPSGFQYEYSKKNKCDNFLTPHFVSLNVKDL